MPNYCVEINGQNFLIDLDGRRVKLGFFTSRFVESADESVAEYQAEQMVRDAQSLRGTVLNTVSDPPTIEVLSVVEVDALRHPQPGLVWYPEKTKRWWEFWKR